MGENNIADTVSAWLMALIQCECVRMLDERRHEEVRSLGAKVPFQSLIGAKYTTFESGWFLLIDTIELGCDRHVTVNSKVVAYEMAWG